VASPSELTRAGIREAQTIRALRRQERVWGMRVPYRRVDDLAGVLAWLAELGSRAVVFDVEPLIARWGTDGDVLRRGVDDTLAQVRTVEAIEVVGFAATADAPTRASVGFKAVPAQ